MLLRTCWANLLLLALTLAPVQRVAACSCYPAHPQTHYCRSDFVVVLKVKKMIAINDQETQYKVKINRIFKADEESHIALKQNIIYTASMSSVCGVTLDSNETYIVGGRVYSGKPNINICGLVMRWPTVTSRQRKGFRKLYQHGCICEVKYTPWWRKGAELESAAGKRCIWESIPGPQECQEQYGVCMMGRGGCSWAPSVPYDKCIKEHQRQREQQRAREP